MSAALTHGRAPPFSPRTTFSLHVSLIPSGQLSSLLPQPVSLEATLWLSPNLCSRLYYPQLTHPNLTELLAVKLHLALDFPPVFHLFVLQLSAEFALKHS